MYATKSRTAELALDPQQQTAQEPQIVNAPLVGTEWVWLHTELPNGDLVSTEKRESFVLKLHEDKSVTSTTDCNSLSGTYIQNGEALSFPPFAMTKMYCEGSFDTDYAKQLERAASHQIIENRMYINLGGNAGKMVFEKK